MNHRIPDDNDVPVNETAAVTLDSGQEAVVTFSPIQNITEHAVIVLAVSKQKDTTYTIEMDGGEVYGPAAIPPTDIDDTVQTFIPPRSFSSECRVKVANTGASTRTYHVQLIGYEKAEGGS